MLALDQAVLLIEAAGPLVACFVSVDFH